MNPESVQEELEHLGYRKWKGPGKLRIGEFHREGNALAAKLRSFPTPTGLQSPKSLEILFRSRRIRGLRQDGQDVRGVRLEPPLLATFYGPQQEERRPIQLQEVPETLVQSVLAVEDDSFFSHSGLSISGILRAAWVNVTGGKVSQGGSTLTQQLVKNLFLTHERTFSRKLREAVLAILVELRYDKTLLLEAYLNEIYLGRRHGANLIGVGAASYAFFNKSVSELDLAEAATLAGMIRAPAFYDPSTHPERSLERRKQVLQRLASLRWIPQAPLSSAEKHELQIASPPPTYRQMAYFSQWAKEEAQQRFGVSSLPASGLTLLSTLDRSLQEKAVSAANWGMDALEKGWEKNRQEKGTLQIALVSIDPRTGGVLAYLGGRDFAASQFDRAAKAKRQAGSAFKPAVYATAFESRAASPSSLVDDSPLTVRLAGKDWSPRNSDNQFDGWMSVRSAVERSRNVPTVRLALQVGLPRIVEMARRLGISAPLKPLPSLALGAFEVTPLEMATVYGTLANGGIRTSIHGLEAVLDTEGKPIEGKPLAKPEAVLSRESSYLLTSVLQGVFERGTAKSARRDGLEGPFAGKTGTTNGRRDSWFAGYTADRASVVWVGYDDNSDTKLSGTRAALPIWARFVAATRPQSGYQVVEKPDGITTAVIDPESGQLTTEDCPRSLSEVFLAGEEPNSFCSLHSRERFPRYERIPRGERQKHPFRHWLDRVFKGRKEGERRKP